jgi:hypothetical protein
MARAIPITPDEPQVELVDHAVHFLAARFSDTIVEEACDVGLDTGPVRLGRLPTNAVEMGAIVLRNRPSRAFVVIDRLAATAASESEELPRPLAEPLAQHPHLAKLLAAHFDPKRARSVQNDLKEIVGSATGAELRTLVREVLSEGGLTRRSRSRRPRSGTVAQRIKSLLVPDHAVLRFQERVDSAASAVEARMAIQQIARLGKASSRPRHWMCDTRSEPGTVYIYWHQRPGVALLVRDGCVVTVYTRKLTRGARQRRRERSREGRIQPRLLDPVVDADDWGLAA